MRRVMIGVLAAGVVGATVAVAQRPAAPPAGDAAVQAVIDARLHELLVRMNARHGAAKPAQ